MKTVKEKYKLPEKFILYIGTLQPRKNIPVLVDAYSRICHSGLDPESSVKTENNTLDSRFHGNDIRLVIAGGKGHNYDQGIDEAVKKYNLGADVIFPGFIDEDDKAALLKGAVVYAFPSLYEGFGIPILEAMSVGTPVVASDISPHKEISGDAALFFDPSNPQDLADKLQKVINDDNLRHELVQKGLEKVKEYSWKKTAEKMLEIFEGMK